MKRISLIAVCLAALAITASAQPVFPGWGIGISSSNQRLYVRIDTAALRASDWLASVLDSSTRARYRGRPVVPVQDFALSDTSAHWTVVAQNAIDSTKGKILVFTPGLYRLRASVNPYDTTTLHCLDLGAGGNEIWIMPGATLMLADSQQVDSSGAVHMIVWEDGRNIYLGGGGQIIGNTAGQPGWTGGYGQISTGCIINGYSATMDRTAANRNITIEGLTLADHWANPVNIDYGEYVTLRGIYSWGIGEGIQFSNVDYGLFEDCTLNDSSDVLVGDGFEMAGCRWSRMRGVTQLAPNTAGGGIDMSYSKYCIVSGFLLDGGAYALNTQGTLGSQYNDWNRFENGTIKRMTGYAMSHIDGTVIYDNVTVDSCVHGFYFARPDAQAAASRIVIQNCTLTNMSGDIGYVRDSVDFTLSGGLIDRYDQGITVEGTGTNPGQSPILSITGTTFRNGASGITFANTGSDSAWRPRGVIRDLYFSNVPNPIAGAADDQDSIRFDYIHSQGANPARHVVRNEYLYFADHTDGGDMLMAVRHPQDSASYLSLLSRNPATGYIYMGAQGTVDAYYRLPYLEFAAGPSFLSLDRTSSRMTLGGRRVLRNEGPWGADKDSMEVVTKGYVDAQIAGIAAGIDTVSLHAQLFADINDKLASWRDTSRAWRTYVNRKGGAVIIDSSGALYTFSLDADSVTVWKTDTSGNGAWYYKLPKSLFDMMAGLRDTSRAWRTYINAGTNVTVDSSDALYTISATGVWATGDSLRRISAAPIPLYGHGVFGSNPDTAEIRIFGANVAGALGAGSTAAYMGYTAGHFPRSVVLDAVEITHAFDTLGALRRRDTLIYLSGLDSIPAGTNVWFSYHPASDVAINGTGAQVISLYYATINAASGTFSDFRWKLPLILGTLTAHMGVHSDHNLKVTLWAREKIPGRVY